MSQPKKTKQDLLTELNTVLSVRAEKIRQRLQDEKQMIDEGAFNTTVGDIGIQNLKENMTPLELGNTITITSEDQSSSLVTKMSQIPISKARQRRQLKRKEISTGISNVKTTRPGGQTKTKPIGTTVNIKNYRPGYNWNIGGRVKELRIRCLARKFLLLWCKKIFGRVRPSVAINHYKTQLMSKAFTEWYNYWWSIVKEWRLCIRADCHYRYKLWLHIFTRWKEFIHYRRQKQTKFKLAYTFCHQHLILSAWHEWRNFISYKHGLKVLIKKADNFRAICWTSKCWKVWRAQQKAVYVRQEKMTQAKQFWSHKLQMQHWLIWKSALEERQNLQKKFVNATQHHNSLLVTKCFKNWQLYVKHRRTKKKKADFARQVYHISLLKRYFNHVHQQWVQIRSMRQHHLQIEMHSKRFRRHWILWRWRQYIELVKEKKALENVAVNFYHNYLQKTCLQVLRLNVVHCRIKVMRNHLAKHLRDTQLQRTSWNCWKSAFEAREELKIAPETELARKHYNAKIISRCFYSLVNYTQWRKFRKKQYAQADAHYYLHAMPKYLYCMQIFVEKEKNYRANSLKSLAFQRYTLQQKVFQKWKRAEKESRDERMMDRMALLHRENVIVQSSFTLWSQRTQESLLEAKKLSEVKVYYLQSLIYKAWTAWRTVVMEKKKYILNDKKATEHYRLKTFKKSFHQWKKWFSDKRSKQQKIRRAANHHKLKTFKKCITVWKALVAQARVFTSLAEKKYQLYSEKTLRTFLYEWRSVTVYLSVQKKKVQMIKRLHQKNIVVKIFHEWHKYASTNAFKKSQAQMLLSEAQIYLQQTFKLQLYFKHWMQASGSSSTLHKKYQFAVDFNKKKSLSKVMKSWKDYSRLCLKKKLLARQCSWFHDVRVTAKTYFIWKHRFSELMEEQQQSQIALWQWSLVLQRKILIAWTNLVEERKQKRCRLATAAALWRENLLKQACSQWLATADSLVQMRSNMAAKHQAKTIFDSFHIVHKCALHWKVWTKRRLLGQGSEKKKFSGATSNVPLEYTLQKQAIKYSLPSSATGSATGTKLFHPQLTAFSPAKPVSINNHFPAHSSKRPQPKRPEFLVNSLKRAGLNNFVYDCDAENQGISNNDEQFKLLESQEKVQEAAAKSDELQKIISKHHINQDGSDVTFLPPNTFQPVESHQTFSQNFQDAYRIPSTSATYPHNGGTLYTDMEGDSFFNLKSSRLKEFTASPRCETQVFPSDSKALGTHWTQPFLLEQPYLMEDKSSQGLTQPTKSAARDNFVLLKPEDFMKKAFPRGRQEVTLETETFPSQLVTGISIKPFIESKSTDVHYEHEHLKPMQCSSKETSLAYVDSKTVSPAPDDASRKRSSLETEIFNIRDKLKYFKSQKKKLSSLQKQYQQLSDWLTEQEAQDDSDVIEASKELELLQKELAKLECEVGSLQPVCEKLVQRAHVLIRTFATFESTT